MIVSLNVDSLLANKPLEETMNICCNSLFDNEAKIKNFSRNDIKKILIMTLRYNFNFEHKIYKTNRLSSYGFTVRR